MHQRTDHPVAPARTWLADLLPLVLLAGLTLNGLMVTIMTVGLSGDGTSMLLGIGPFQLATALIAATLVLRAEDKLPRALWLEVPIVLAILVPSSAVSWTALVLYAGFIAFKTRGPSRIGALLFVGLGAASLWSAVAMNWFAGPITSFEALMVANVLSLVVADVAWNGNVLGIAGGFQLIVLPACASADLVPKAVLALAAIAAFFGVRFDRRFARIALVTALLLIAGNWLRLAAMAVSAEHYTLIHGPVGANLFDLFQSVLIIAAGYLLIDDTKAAHHA